MEDYCANIKEEKYSGLPTITAAVFAASVAESVVKFMCVVARGSRTERLDAV